MLICQILNDGPDDAVHDEWLTDPSSGPSTRRLLVRPFSDTDLTYLHTQYIFVKINSFVSFPYLKHKMNSSAIRHYIVRSLTHSLHHSGSVTPNICLLYFIPKNSKPLGLNNQYSSSTPSAWKTQDAAWRRKTPQDAAGHAAERRKTLDRSA